MKIIAEIGLNHCGSTERAQNLVQALNNTSVDAISFQIREKEFYDETHPRKFQLPITFYKSALNQIHSSNKELCIAIAEPEMVRKIDDIGVNTWKTLSWDLENYDLHQSLKETRKLVYISTGISSIEEISSVSKKLDNVIFIHTQLNDSIDNANLKAINTIRNITNKPTAFGLHCNNHLLLYLAIGFEPAAIFFYVKDETNGEHPDDAHAIPISSVEQIITSVKTLVKGIGDGKKEVLTNTMHPADDNICE